MTSEAVPARRRSRVGIVALVIALFTLIAPFVAWIVMWIVGATEASNADDAIMIGLLGGAVIFFGVIALLSPLSVLALVLGIVGLARGGGKASGVFAIVIGAIGALGLFWLPFTLEELIPR